MIVTIGWPDKRLSPNARLHWSAKAKAAKASREAAKYLTWGAAGGVRELRSVYDGAAPIPIKVTFFPPDNRRRDHDNLIACCKSLFDGIADALGVDDNRFRPSFDFANAQAPGRVEVHL